MDNYIKKIIYLGPNGSNSETAVNLFIGKTGIYAEKVPISTITKAIEVLDIEDDATIGVLPIENSIEGIVRETIDNLVKTQSKLFIQAELSVPINHCLIGKGKKENIKTIVSISQAIAQCREYIAKNFPSDIKTLLYSSTSASAEFVSNQDSTYASIAPEKCAMMYGLNVIEKNINDIKDNKTNFIIISKKKLFKGNETRTLIAFTTNNEPGALLSVLEVFKKYGLNMTYLESRPSKKVFGEYIFYAEVDKGRDNIEDALSEIKEKSTFQRILGSYCLI